MVSRSIDVAADLAARRGTFAIFKRFARDACNQAFKILCCMQWKSTKKNCTIFVQVLFKKTMVICCPTYQVRSIRCWLNEEWKQMFGLQQLDVHHILGGCIDSFAPYHSWTFRTCSSCWWEIIHRFPFHIC